MNKTNKIVTTTIKLAAAVALVSSLGACANMSRQQAHAGVGAAAGGALGYLVTGGPIGTVAGAAAGGLIGAGVR
jgi:osmotically inducible lipoprotein OsmB